MKSRVFSPQRIFGLVAASFTLATIGCADDPGRRPPILQPSTPAPAVGVSSDGSPIGSDTYLRTADELDQLLAPVALYPDPLLGLILPASTLPDEISAAAAFLDRGGPPENAESQGWDASVAGLTHYPEVLRWLEENHDWTAQLGDTFRVQPADVMAAVQRLRDRARESGALATGPEQVVTVDDSIIYIEPADPDIIYVPYYDPDVIFFGPRRMSTPFVSFSIGFTTGAWLAYDCDWHRHRIWRGDFYRGGHPVWRVPDSGREWGPNPPNLYAWQPPPRRVPPHHAPDRHEPPPPVVHPQPPRPAPRPTDHPTGRPPRPIPSKTPEPEHHNPPAPTPANHPDHDNHSTPPPGHHASPAPAPQPAPAKDRDDDSHDTHTRTRGNPNPPRADAHPQPEPDIRGRKPAAPAPSPAPVVVKPPTQPAPAPTVPPPAPRPTPKPAPRPTPAPPAKHQGPPAKTPAPAPAPPRAQPPPAPAPNPRDNHHDSSTQTDKKDDDSKKKDSDRR